MNFVTTNIRIPEEDYLRLKTEAAKKRRSLAAVIREKIGASDKMRSEAEVERLMAETMIVAKRNAKILNGWDSLKALREIRAEN
ncbi:MAG: hypothetical protein Q8Q86_02900 [Candidatus Daviesbacteria bacterium]|nr:hypothetical protein [Candidatus Daviesbacteria bacterium]